MKASASSDPATSPDHSRMARGVPNRSIRSGAGGACASARVSAVVVSTLPCRPGLIWRVSASCAWTTPAPVHGFVDAPSASCGGAGALGGGLQPGDELLRGLPREALAQQRQDPADLGRRPRRRDLADDAHLAGGVDRDRARVGAATSVSRLGTT